MSSIFIQDMLELIDNATRKEKEKKKKGTNTEREEVKLYVITKDMILQDYPKKFIKKQKD